LFQKVRKIKNKPKLLPEFHPQLALYRHYFVGSC